MGTWTLEDAVVVCTKIETVAPHYGCHVALTGGLLYKKGARKDCDVVLYRIRQVTEIDLVGLFAALKPLGIDCPDVSRRWCLKATFQGLPLDILLPDHGGEYPPDSQNDVTAAPVK